MKQALKKIVLSSPILIKIANELNKRKLKRKYGISYGKGVFIGFSVAFEGDNSFERNSSITGSSIGYGSYLGVNTQISKTKIGRYCSIGPDVKCIFGKHPTHTIVSSHPAFFSTRGQAGFTYVQEQKFDEFEAPRDKGGKYSIVIGNDVWIGANVTLLDGVHIGDGAIIASNSVITKDVTPYTIVGGVPAKTIKQRFTEEQIKFLLTFKWWEKPKTWVATNAPHFLNIADFCEKFKND